MISKLGMTQEFAYKEFVYLIFKRYSLNEMLEIQNQIQNKTFKGKLICGFCFNELDSIKDNFTFSGKPKLYPPDLTEEEETKLNNQEEEFTILCNKCHNNIWGCDLE